MICGGAAVVYSYRSGTGQIASRNWQIGEDAPFLTFNDNYDALDRLSGVSVDDVPEISYTLTTTVAVLLPGAGRRQHLDLRI